MKLRVLIYIAIVFCTNAFAQSIQNDSVAPQILNELQTIRGFHEQTHEQKQRAVIERQRRDSINNRQFEDDILSDYGIMARIEDNTHPDPVSDGWNLYGIVAMFIASLSLIASIVTYLAQSKTEKNTKKLSQEAQRHLLNELLRHLYRNFVIIYTMRTKLEDIDFKGYPSEEHFVKMKIPLDNIHLDAFYGFDEQFRLLHVLYLNLRNYNNEIDVALKHITNPALSKEVKLEDLDTLEFKISYLTGRIIDTINRLWGESTQNYNDMRAALQISTERQTNANDNIDVDGSDDFTKLSVEDFGKTEYKRLYNDAELENLCHTFNYDVKEERKRNHRGAWKVRIIKF